jgi:hypothetical protein
MPVLEHAYAAIVIGAEGNREKTQVVYGGYQGHHYLRWHDGHTYKGKRTSKPDVEPAFEFKRTEKLPS